MQRRAGQAFIELIVALVAVLAITAGLLQIASLGRAHTEAMVAARREAGQFAMLPIGPMDNPDYIADWDSGPDGKPLTADDLPVLDDPGPFNDLIVSRASPTAAGWALLESGAVTSSLPVLHNNFDPVSQFGLVRGYEEETVELLSAVQSLLYQAPSITVEAEVWMTRATDIE